MFPEIFRKILHATCNLVFFWPSSFPMFSNVLLSSAYLDLFHIYRQSVHFTGYGLLCKVLQYWLKSKTHPLETFIILEHAAQQTLHDICEKNPCIVAISPILSQISPVFSHILQCLVCWVVMKVLCVTLSTERQRIAWFG